GALRGEDPVVGDPRAVGRFEHLRIVWVEDDVFLRLVQVVLVRRGGRLGDPIGVIKYEPDVPEPAHAGLRAHRRLPLLDSGVTERTLLGLAGAVIEVDLLVRAPGDAHPPPAAFVLIDEHDAVLGALVDRTGGAGGHARGVEAVFADAGEV